MRNEAHAQPLHQARIQIRSDTHRHGAQREHSRQPAQVPEDRAENLGRHGNVGQNRAKRHCDSQCVAERNPVAERNAVRRRARCRGDSDCRRSTGKCFRQPQHAHTMAAVEKTANSTKMARHGHTTQNGLAHGGCEDRDDHEDNERQRHDAGHRPARVHVTDHRAGHYGTCRRKTVYQARNQQHLEVSRQRARERGDAVDSQAAQINRTASKAIGQRAPDQLARAHAQHIRGDHPLYAVVTGTEHLLTMAGSAGSMASMAMAWMAIRIAVNATNSPKPDRSSAGSHLPGCVVVKSLAAYSILQLGTVGGSTNEGACNAFEKGIPAARSVERAELRRPGGAFAAEKKDSNVRLGVQTYSFREMLGKPGDMTDKMIAAMRQLGLTECELWEPTAAAAEPVAAFRHRGLSRRRAYLAAGSRTRRHQSPWREAESGGHPCLRLQLWSQ